MCVLLSARIYVCAQNLNSLGCVHPHGSSLSAFPSGQVILSPPGVVVFLWYNHVTCIALVIIVLVCVSWQEARHVELWHNWVKGMAAVAFSCDSNHRISTFSAVKYCWPPAVFSWMMYRHDPIRSSFSHQSLLVSSNGSVLSQHHSGFDDRLVRFVSLILCIISTASLVRFIASVLVCVCCVICVLFCIITKIPANPIAKILMLMSISMMVNPLIFVFCFLLVIAIQKIISK